MAPMTRGKEKVGNGERIEAATLTHAQHLSEKLNLAMTTQSPPSSPNTQNFYSDLSSAEIFSSCSSLSSYSNDEPFPNTRKPESPHLTSKGDCNAGLESDCGEFIANEVVNDSISKSEPAHSAFDKSDPMPKSLRFSSDEHVSDSYSIQFESSKARSDEVENTNAEVSLEIKEKRSAEVEEYEAMDVINAIGDSEEEEDNAYVGPTNTGILRFQPLFTHKDEITILKRMVKYSRPVKLTTDGAKHFHGLIIHSLSRAVTCYQLSLKLRKLKRKCISRACVPAKHLNSHEKKLIELGKKIWDDVKDNARRVRPEDLKEKFPLLTNTVIEMQNGVALEYLETLSLVKLMSFEKQLQKLKMADEKHDLKMMRFRPVYCKWVTKDSR